MFTSASRIPARQARPTEDATKKSKLDRNYHLRYIPTIDECGNVKMRLIERFTPKVGGFASSELTIAYDFFYPKKKIVEFVEANCKPNSFYQPNLEGAIARRRDRLDAEFQSRKFPPSEEELFRLGFYYAILTVFRSLGSYDSYYGAGVNAGYDLKSKIGLS